MRQSLQQSDFFWQLEQGQALAAVSLDFIRGDLGTRAQNERLLASLKPALGQG